MYIYIYIYIYIDIYIILYRIISIHPLHSVFSLCSVFSLSLSLCSVLSLSLCSVFALSLLSALLLPGASTNTHRRATRAFRKHWKMWCFLNVFSKHSKIIGFHSVFQKRGFEWPQQTLIAEQLVSLKNTGKPGVCWSLFQSA